MSEHSHHPAISRRNVMILGGVALVAGALPASFHLFEPDNGTLADKLMSLLTDKEGAARLGVLLMQAHSLPRETDAIAAVIIGGASFFGGVGSIGNTIIGVLLIAVLRNGLNLQNVDSSYQTFAIGAVIIIAVFVDVVRQRFMKSGAQ